MKYVPEQCPQNPAEIPEYIMRELPRIAASLDQTHTHDELHAEPAKLEDGMVVYADGTDWDPGAGEGLYVRVNDRWILMSSGQFLLDVAKGLIPGHSIVNKFGENIAVASGTTEVVADGGGTLVLPATADITHISQATDQAADRGLSVQVEGLDTSWAKVVQSVVLDGSDSSTPVTLSTALKRSYRLEVNDTVTAGDDISVHNVGDTQDYATILAGNNQTLMSVYTVPAGKTAYLFYVYGTLNKSSANSPDGAVCKLWSQDNTNGYAPKLKLAFGLALAGASVFDKEYKLLPSYAEKTDLYITAYSQGGVSDVSAGFDLLLVDD